MILEDDWTVELYSCCGWMFRIEGTARPITWPVGKLHLKQNTVRACPDCGTQIPVKGQPVEVDMGIADLEKVDPKDICTVCGLELEDGGLANPEYKMCPVGCTKVRQISDYMEEFLKE